MSDLTREQADALVRSRGFTVLLVVAAVIGVLVSLVAWCFLEAVHWVAGGDVRASSARVRLRGRSTDVVAAARPGAHRRAGRGGDHQLPGQGGHVPVHGLPPAVRRTPRSCRGSCWPRWRRSGSVSCSVRRRR